MSYIKATDYIKNNQLEIAKDFEPCLLTRLQSQVEKNMQEKQSLINEIKSFISISHREHLKFNEELEIGVTK